MPSPPIIRSRSVRDGLGTVWRISESDARDTPGAMSDTCLIFDSQAVCRRYWKYPGDWFTLPEDNLLAFMNRSRLSPR